MNADEIKEVLQYISNFDNYTTRTLNPNSQFNENSIRYANYILLHLNIAKITSKRNGKKSYKIINKQKLQSLLKLEPEEIKAMLTSLIKKRNASLAKKSQYRGRNASLNFILAKIRGN